VKTSNSLWQLTLVRFREFVREPEAIFWTFVFPILLTAGLGLAFRNKPADVVKVGTTSQEIASRLKSEKGLAVEVSDRAVAEQSLRTGRVVLLVLPDQGGRVDYKYDDTNPDARTAKLLADRALLHASGVSGPDVKEELVREAGARYVDFLVPGLLGMNLMGSGIWGLGFAIVDARRKKLLKRLVASPMSRSEYLLSFVLSRLVWLVAEVVVLLGFAGLVFGIPFRGPLWQLLLLCLLGALVFSALGLLIASRAQTIEAASGLMNVTMMPMWVLSGVFFSAERFPDAIQPFIRALPLTAVIDSLRGNMLQGLTIEKLWPQVGVMLAWFVVCFFTALRLFRWK
jgi:ABC-2 type transport system permease protein